MVQKLTKEQCVIITGFTGSMHGSFSDFHQDVEKRLGRPVWTHEFAGEEMKNKLKEIYKDDFLSIQPDKE